MAKLISNRYATALFELALELKKLDKFNNEVEFVYNSIINDSKFIGVLNHPQVGSDEKMSMLENIFKGNVSDEILGLFSVILRKNREAEITEILSLFLDKVKDYKGIVTAYVYSAAPLKDEQIDSIKQKLSQKLNKQVIIQTEICKDLIGGIKINVDGHVIDASIKKQIENLKKQLLNVQLA